MTDPPPVASARAAVRVLILDQDNRVLLVRFWDDDRSWWCTPGGGIEAGESADAAVRREINEELGIEGVEVGPCIWTRHHVGVFRGRPFDQTERIYLVRTATFQPRPTAAALETEHGLDDIRWWTLDELALSTEEFAPRRILELLRDILDRGPPPAPIDVGI